MKINGYDVSVINNQLVKVGCCKVTLEEAEQVIKMMKEYKEPPKFEVGRYVRLKNCHNYQRGLDGIYGKIVGQETGDVFYVETHCKMPQTNFVMKTSMLEDWAKLNNLNIDHLLPVSTAFLEIID